MAIKIIDEKLEFKSNHSTRTRPPGGIVLHHAAASKADVKTVHQWHLSRGWAGIGYHFYVRKDGSIYKGREENWRGAHTSYHNDKIGICAEGNFETETMSAVQKNAIIDLLAYLFDKYGEMEVFGHRDLDRTACPGKNYPFDEIVKLNKTVTSAAKKENIVKKFQLAAMADGIPLPVYGADGLWGPETSRATNCLVKEGIKGERVKLIQTLLGGLDVDGIFGPKTEAAVRAFQSKRGLDVDGIVGFYTWRALLGV